MWMRLGSHMLVANGMLPTETVIIMLLLTAMLRNAQNLAVSVSWSIIMNHQGFQLLMSGICDVWGLKDIHDIPKWTVEESHYHRREELSTLGNMAVWPNHLTNMSWDHIYVTTDLSIKQLDVSMIGRKSYHHLSQQSSVHHACGCPCRCYGRRRNLVRSSEFFSFWENMQDWVDLGSILLEKMFKIYDILWLWYIYILYIYHSYWLILDMNSRDQNFYKSVKNHLDETIQLWGSVI